MFLFLIEDMLHFKAASESSKVANNLFNFKIV